MPVSSVSVAISPVIRSGALILGAAGGVQGLLHLFQKPSLGSVVRPPSPVLPPESLETVWMEERRCAGGKELLFVGKCVACSHRSLPPTGGEPRKEPTPEGVLRRPHSKFAERGGAGPHFIFSWLLKMVFLEGTMFHALPVILS